MNYDEAILWMAGRGGKSLREAKEAGVDESLLVGNARGGWKFLVKYTAENGTPPPPSLIQEHTGAVPERTEEGVTIRYLAEQLFDRKQFHILQDHITEAGRALNSGNQREAADRLLEDAEKLRKLRSSGLRLHTLADTAREVQESYYRTARGERGIELPWETLNQITLGLHPGTLTFWAARPAVGKTHCAVICAVAAWAKGNRVLFVSPEMGRVELCERVIAHYGKLNYSGMVSGQLGAFSEPVLEQTVSCLENTAESHANRFFILDDEGMMSPSAIEDAVEACEADHLIVDSTYMLRAVEGKGKVWRGDKKERVDAIAEWLRSLARSTEIPVVAISQLSRDAKKIKRGSRKKVKEGESTGGLEDTLAFTDVILQYSHNVFALMQDEDLRMNQQMAIVILKVRRPTRIIRSLVVNWNLETMDFSEIGAETEPEFEDRDYDVQPF